MSKCYLLPCSKSDCQQKIEVETRHAGGTIACPKCGTDVSVPRLRELKQLAPPEISGKGSDSDKFTQPNRTKSVLFSSGLGLAVIAGAIGWVIFNYGSGLVEETASAVGYATNNVNVPVQDAEPEILWDLWHSNPIIDDELPDWSESIWTRYNKQGKILRNISYGIFGVAGIGALLMVGSFILPSKTK